jgi:hypothetical protein
MVASNSKLGRIFASRPRADAPEAERSRNLFEGAEFVQSSTFEAPA